MGDFDISSVSVIHISPTLNSLRWKHFSQVLSNLKWICGTGWYLYPEDEFNSCLHGEFDSGIFQQAYALMKYGSIVVIAISMYCYIHLSISVRNACMKQCVDSENLPHSVGLFAGGNIFYFSLILKYTSFLGFIIIPKKWAIVNTDIISYVLSYHFIMWFQ